VQTDRQAVTSFLNPLPSKASKLQLAQRCLLAAALGLLGSSGALQRTALVSMSSFNAFMLLCLPSAM